MQTQHRDPVLAGGCQYGAVRYAIFSEKLDGDVVCHCRMCQRAVGAPFLAAFPIKKTDFEWTTGEPASFKSSSIAERHFCARCGTSLSYSLPESDNVDVTICSLDDPTLVEPTRQTGMESQLEWVGNILHLPALTSKESMGALLDGSINYQSIVAGRVGHDT